MTLRLAALIAGTSLSCTAAALDAEYAFRWDPSRGGPGTAEDVAQALQLGNTKERRFEVRYLSVGGTREIPRGFTALARERSDADGAESTYKLRGPPSASSTDALRRANCPLVGPKQKTKLELDVNWARKAPGAAIEPRRSLSWSCEVEASARTAFPPALQAVAMPCVNRVRRLKAGDWKVEEWALATGRSALEVSYSVADSPAAQQTFQKAVQRLTSLRAQPLEESKTTLGSSCAHQHPQATDAPPRPGPGR